VLEVISQHSSENKTKPSTIEAKILYDADKIDGLGAIGIARVFAFCGQNGMPPKKAIERYKKKINLAIPQMQTEIGKKLAEKEFKCSRFFQKV